MSTLLEQASLVLIPSGYKEDTVYSVIPSNGTGDMSFTRASDGTRINSDGLVEVCPWNLLQYSEQFDNAYWTKEKGGIASIPVVTTNAEIAPDGTTSADTIVFTLNGGTASGDISQIRTIGFTHDATAYTQSIYAKTTDGTSKIFSFITPSGDISQITITGIWQRFSLTSSLSAVSSTFRLRLRGSASGEGTSSSATIALWGAQYVQGSTAKPYFPTTDRLNVPRLTYQNGGGGCPSLLLEPQRTNIVKYSQEFDNVFYTKTNVTITPNTTISPDGTQNADTATYIGNGYFDQTIAFAAANLTHTISCWVKVPSGTQIFRLKMTNATVVDYFSPNLTATTEWQRFTFTQAFGATSGGFIVGVQCSTIATLNIWGLQLETNSSYATSYIPTVASSATRIADACSKTGISSLIGQTEGVLFADFVINGRTNNTNILNSEKNTVCSFFFSANTNGNIDCGLFASAVTKARITAGSVAVNQRAKVAYAYKSGNSALYINGVQVGTSADTYTLPSTLDDIFLNDITTYFSYQESVNFNQVILFPTRLTNAQLVTLTTI